MAIEDKQKYEERAGKINEAKEAAAKAAAPSQPPPAASPSPATPVLGKGKDASKDVDMVAATAALKKDPDWIFECCWDGCDWQFEDALDLIEHCVQEPKGHVSTYFKDQNPTGAYLL